MCWLWPGRGHEQGQTIGGVVYPFDDVSVIRGLVGVLFLMAADLACGQRPNWWKPPEVTSAQHSTRQVVSIDTRTIQPGDYSSRCVVRPVTATITSPRHSRRVPLAQWCIRTSRQLLHVWWSMTSGPDLTRLGAFARERFNGRVTAGNGQRRQDHDQGDAAHCAFGIRVGSRCGCILQYSLGRAADARAHSACGKRIVEVAAHFG